LFNPNPGRRQQQKRPVAAIWPLSRTAYYITAPGDVKRTETVAFVLMAG